MKYLNKWLHKSHLKVYEFCPKKFDETYVDVIRKDKKQYAIALKEGTAVHDWFAYIVDNNITDINMIKEHIKIKSLYDMIEWFITINNKMNNLIDETELFLKTNSKLRGTIDRYYLNENDEGVLVEYKTGRSNTFSNTWVDFGFYTILLSDNGYKVDKWRMINPRLKKDITKDVNVSKIEKVRDLISEIRTIETFEPNNKITWACNDCAYKMQCHTYNKRLPFNDYISVLERI